MKHAEIQRGSYYSLLKPKIPRYRGAIERSAKRGGKFFVQIGPTFNNFLKFYPTSSNLKHNEIFLKYTNLGVLVCQRFNFLAGK